MKTKINKEKCIGCGTCAAIAGETFEMNEENIAEVIVEEVTEEENAQMAADACPTQAIEIE